MNFIDEKLAQYSELHTEKEPAILKALNRETYANYLYPQMISGHLQGQLLTMISKIIAPKLILEVGTFTGYSAICLAQGLAPGGILHTIDNNPELKEVAMKYFKKSGLANKIKLHQGTGIDIIPKLKGKFDLVFIDADKINYSKYFDLALAKLRKGGIILADNALWSGKVLLAKKDKDTEDIVAFNKKVQRDKRVENILMPIRDGVMMIRKK